jgi:hypothetical protein
MALLFKSASGEPIRVALLSGHTTIIRDDWIELDPMFHREALANGAITNEMQTVPQVVPIAEAVEHSDRDLIRQALQQMLERSQPDDFTRAGLPDLTATRALVGKRVAKEDIYAVWQAMQSEA